MALRSFYHSIDETDHAPTWGRGQANVEVWYNLSMTFWHAVLFSVFWCVPCIGPASTVHDDTVRPGTLEGRIRDAFQDDVDHRFAAILIDCGQGATFAFLQHDNAHAFVPWLQDQIGCHVVIRGDLRTFQRPYLRRHIKEALFFLTTNDITILSRPQTSPYDAPSLQDSPPNIQCLDTCEPRKANGVVLARWSDDSFILRTDNGDSVKIRLRDNHLPSVGDSVEVVGIVATDLYYYSLVRAQWRRSSPIVQLSEDVRIEPIAPSINKAIDTGAYGRTIRIRGTLKSVLADDKGFRRLLLDDGRFKIMIDCSTIPEAVNDLPEGCKLEVTGVGVFESENWHANTGFPKISGMFIVPRVPSDVRILQRPPWWTPTRIWSVVGILSMLLFGILIWNILLQRLAARKGRELMREQIGHIEAQLKTEERTRLAVELHDSLAQNLTGVSMRLDAARRMPGAPTKMVEDLEIASKALLSCRAELRNCLWDLRHETLEIDDMDAAIRQTLEPHIEGANLSIRFSVQRRRFSDTTAHTILCIIRELAINAIRHGGATAIRVAGSIDNGKLLFSVRDNGCGFDPTNCPDDTQGHYGLLGIRERASTLDGSVSINSIPSQGTKITVTLAIAKEKS